MASVLLCCSSVRLKLISLIGKSHFVVSPVMKSLFYNNVGLLLLLLLQLVLQLGELRCHLVALGQELVSLVLHLSMKPEKLIEVFLIVNVHTNLDILHLEDGPRVPTLHQDTELRINILDLR
jgi:hypothetical protein